MWFISGFLSLLGRTMLCAIFLMAAVAGKIPNFEETITRMAAEGIPAPKWMLIGAIAFLIVGSLAVVLGFKARCGALLLFVFLCAATYYFHDFWNMEFASGELASNELMHFMKNLAIGGGLLTIVANGSGAWSLDCRTDDTDEEYF
jgi:putative oxidoreductase